MDLIHCDHLDVTMAQCWKCVRYWCPRCRELVPDDKLPPCHKGKIGGWFLWATPSSCPPCWEEIEARGDRVRHR